MIPGPARIICCPFCGGEKELMNLMSGNTCGATIWSDTRRNYPMLPELSPIQQCPHCKNYYFLEDAHTSHNPIKGINGYSFELGELTYAELKEAKEQMENSDLTKKQTWILNHQLFMAYNDAFFRTDNPDSSPTKEDEEYIKTIITQLLEGIDHNDDYDLFHAELLRESGRFTEAFMILDKNTSEKQKWVVDAMMKHIIAKDPKPFLLVEDGNVINY